ncbi:hypothetical protein [Methylocapsa sp. S129]|uniref:hypothetical protein n=1 Tax=Methylocapsa sp. S129 TaxID=1641869 RepID=UPI00131D84AC|nr:hypothetical protein [Methylocapsa sp. S129]
MKYLIAVSLAALIASPAFAGASHKSTSLIGNILAPITTSVSALNITALNNVSVLSNNKTNVSAVAPITAVVKNVSVLSGLLGGGSHGCGCN